MFGNSSPGPTRLSITAADCTFTGPLTMPWNYRLMRHIDREGEARQALTSVARSSNVASLAWKVAREARGMRLWRARRCHEFAVAAGIAVTRSS